VIPASTPSISRWTTTGKRHWLHPYERLRHDPRWAAIREKHRQRHLSKKKP